MIRQMPPEKVVYIIIKRFLEIEKPSEEHVRDFHAWLLSPENREAKDNAFDRCFREALSEDLSRHTESEEVELKKKVYRKRQSNYPLCQPD